MNTADALRTALERIQQQIHPERDTAPQLTMITDGSGPGREGWYGDSFHFTLKLDRPSQGDDDDISDS